MTRALRVTVAGAGVLGLTTALALADAGCAVTVCDPGGPNASSIAAGMIAPVFEAVLDEAAAPNLDLLLAARDLWAALEARIGIALDRTGALALGDEDWLEKVEARFAALHLHGAELSGDAARALAPGLSDAVDVALLTREDWRVDAPQALGALKSAAETAGARFDPRIVQDRRDADVLVLATGARDDLEALAPELGALSPIKGHIVRVAAPASGAVVRSARVYAAPGQGMAFGATMEHGRSDLTLEAAKSDPLLAAGLKLFPALRDAPVQVFAGVRAATPDGLPLAGWSRSPGVALAVGPRRNGWLLAPLVARVVTACVLERETGPYAERLDPARFGGMA